MNGSLPEKSEPLLSTVYEPLPHEAKMPDAQLSKAPSVSYREFQLDILTKLAGHLGRNFKPKRGGMAQSVGRTARNYKR